jgi:hypothetical protein
MRSTAHGGFCVHQFRHSTSAGDAVTNKCAEALQESGSAVKFTGEAKLQESLELKLAFLLWNAVILIHHSW